MITVDLVKDHMDTYPAFLRVTCGCQDRSWFDIMHETADGPAATTRAITGVYMDQQLWRWADGRTQVIIEAIVYQGACPECGQEYQSWAWRRGMTAHK